MKNINEQQRATGCILDPHPSRIKDVQTVLGAAGELPEVFIVSSYLSAFPTLQRALKGAVKIKNQFDRPSCVGQATAVQKAAHEGKEISARDCYRQAKRLDGSVHPETWGTSLWAGQDALVEGCADEAVVPELPEYASTREYVSLDDVTSDVELNRSINRARGAYFVPRTSIKSVLHQTDKPVVTSCRWFVGDNDIGHDGRNVMQMPSGQDVGGHAFAIVGWLVMDGVGEVLVAVNSWGETWGDHGFFYIPTKDVIHRLGNGYVSIDIDPTLAEVLERYDGTDVQVPGSPDIWHVEGGQRHAWPDEITWWAFGKLFGFNNLEISKEQLELIPIGKEMNIDDAPFETRELVRQLRQHYGML